MGVLSAMFSTLSPVIWLSLMMSTNTSLPVRRMMLRPDSPEAQVGFSRVLT